MKRKNIIIAFILLLSCVVTLPSCSNTKTGFTKLLKSDDRDLMFNEAVAYYEKGSYVKALQLFDRIAVLVKGTDKEEPLNYYYAQCYYEQSDYVLANYYFKRYVSQFPFSRRADECAYLAAICKYMESSSYSLDPTPTTEAISELQSYINTYPQSDKIEMCNVYIDELRNKLEEKDYQIALMYYKMEEYKASVVCFNNILKDYPSTTHREEIMYRIVCAQYEFAKNSVTDKKKDRFKDVVTSYQKFLSAFPESKYLSIVEDYYNLAKKNI
ncbi:MAG: outer membrane protein assembly factor BamD [Bacteroidales bacterium]|nr:outer membrane protein assembly factor BamD [Bacteroidales bacterium]